jgi:hypothetical protein
VIERLDWQTFVSRFYPESARHDYRVLKAYDAYRKSLVAEQSDTPGDTEALRVREEEGGPIRRRARGWPSPRASRRAAP